MNETIQLSEDVLDIIGDIDENQEPSDVTIYCKGIELYTYQHSSLCLTYFSILL